MGKIKVLIATGLTLGAGLTVQADMTLNGEQTYDVASGATQTIAEKLTGTGSIQKVGKGTLVLAGVGNDFSGGVNHQAGVLQVDAEGALGTGNVAIRQVSSIQLNFNVADASFVNPIQIGGTVNNYFDSSIYPLFFSKNTTLQGPVEATVPVKFRQKPNNTANSFNGGPTTVFENTVTAASDLFYDPYGLTVFKKAVTAQDFYVGTAWSAGGTIELHAPDNSFRMIYLDMGNVLCQAADVFSDAVLSWRNTGSWSISGEKGTGRCDLNGFNQQVKGVDYFKTGNDGWFASRLGTGDKVFCVRSSTPATLTITGDSVPHETYATVQGQVSLVVDAQEHADYVQTFHYNHSKSVGSIAVRKGTLKIDENARFSGMTNVTVEADGTFLCASTNASPALAAVKALKVAGTFDASEARTNPFSTSLTSIELASGAKLKFSAGQLISVAQVKIDGQVLTTGLLTPQTSDLIEGGSIQIGTASATTATWTGNGADTALTTAANWNRDGVDTVYATVLPTFAAGGMQARVDKAAFAGLNLTVPSGFTFTRATTESKLVVNGGVTTEPCAEGVRTFTFDVPTSLLGANVTVASETGNRIVFKNALHADGMVGTLLMGGAGGKLFEGTNVVAGGIRSTGNVWVVTGRLTTPSGEPGGEADATEQSGIYVGLPAWLPTDEVSHGLMMSNAVVDKAVYVRSKMGTCGVGAAPGTTNEIRGFVFLDVNTAWEKVGLPQDSELILSGGLKTTHSFRLYGGGTLRLRGKPGVFTGSNGMNPTYGTVSLEVPNNTFKYLIVGYVPSKGATVETTVDQAITNGYVQVGGYGGDSAGVVPASGSGTYYLDLHDTQQACQKLAVLPKGVLTGEYPSMMKVLEGRGPADAGGYHIGGTVTGGVGLHMAGADDAVLFFTNKVFASCGDLKVSSGTMEFMSGASWLNGTNLVVCGTGTLKIGSNGTFSSRHAQLELSENGKLSIPANVTLAVTAATRNGVKLSAGLYPSGSWNDTISGGGSLCVVGQGTLVIFR